MSERCGPCEAHAELHKGNWLGIGEQPCAQCESHARMHAEENGCAGAVMCILATTATVALLARRKA